MVEKNVLLTTKGKNDEIIVIKPYTSMYNVDGLTDYIDRKFKQFLTKIKGIFVLKEDYSNDFTDEYKDKIDNLNTTTIKTIEINGQEINMVDGKITFSTEEVVDSLNNEDITDIFESV